MSSFLRNLSKSLPTFLLAFIMACAVWVTAVTASDPNQTKVYPTPVAVNLFGQDPGLILSNFQTQQVHITLLAPQSVWAQLNQGNGSVTAVADITGLGPGTHTVPVTAHITNISPVEILKVDPATINVTLEQNLSRTLPFSLIINGEPATGFELGTASFDPSSINISGPKSLVQQVYKVTASINVTQAQADIHQTVSVQAVDINNTVVNNLTLTPNQVAVSIPVTQLGGYKNVVVKIVTKGLVANGYRTTNISVIPANVTVFSSNLSLINSLPGYVDTDPVDLSGAHDDISAQVGLSLPAGVSIVGSQLVTVQVGVAAIETSITLSNMPVKLVNLGPDLAGEVSPSTVDVILSGPLLLLNQLTANEVHVTADMTGQGVGDNNVSLTVSVDITSVNVESVNPSSVQVTVLAATATPFGTPGPSPTVGTPTVPPTGGGVADKPTPSPTPTP